MISSLMNEKTKMPKCESRGETRWINSAFLLTALSCSPKPGWQPGTAEDICETEERQGVWVAHEWLYNKYLQDE